MIPLPTAPKPRFFVSYSRADNEVVTAFSNYLKTFEFDLWIDKAGIGPTETNWDTTIREAIKSSAAVLVMCSPNAVLSRHLQAEVALAERYSRPIVPLWIAGAHWVDSAPLSLIQHQHVDCREPPLPEKCGRDEALSVLLDLVQDSLPPLFGLTNPWDCPGDAIPIVLPRLPGAGLSLIEAAKLVGTRRELAGERGEQDFGSLDVIGFNPKKFSCFQDLLDALYAARMSDAFAPFTYGRDWVLARPSDIYPSHLAVPWSWLRHRRSRPLIEVDPEFVRGRTPLDNFCMSAPLPDWRGSARPVWAVITSDFDNARGVLLNRGSYLNIISRGLKGFRYLVREGAQLRRYDEVDPTIFAGTAILLESLRETWSEIGWTDSGLVAVAIF
jgi:hypothetical protein